MCCPRPKLSDIFLRRLKASPCVVPQYEATIVFSKVQAVVQDPVSGYSRSSSPCLGESALWLRGLQLVFCSKVVVSENMLGWLWTPRPFQHVDSDFSHQLFTKLDVPDLARPR